MDLDPKAVGRSLELLGRRVQHEDQVVQGAGPKKDQVKSTFRDQLNEEPAISIKLFNLFNLFNLYAIYVFILYR